MTAIDEGLELHAVLEEYFSIPHEDYKARHEFLLRQTPEHFKAINYIIGLLAIDEMD